MRIRLPTLFLLTGAAAIAVACWSNAGDEAIALSLLLGAMAFLFSIPLAGVLLWKSSSHEPTCNSIIWATGFVAGSAMTSFALHDQPTHFATWTESGVMLSAISFVAGWIIGAFIGYPLKTTPKDSAS